MKQYRIEDDNTVPVLEQTEPAPGAFDSPEQLERLTAEWPLRRLVEVWNRLPGVPPVTRFENRNVAVQRIWRALETGPRSGNRAVRARGKGGRRRRPPKKGELVLAMLRAPAGATLSALMKVTQWEAHSVRGYLSGKVHKGLGLQVESFKRDGDRVYAIRDPRSDQ